MNAEPMIRCLAAAACLLLAFAAAATAGAATRRPRAASNHSAATENAGELINALTLQRNRERQAAITAELLDIVGGAAAL